MIIIIKEFVDLNAHVCTKLKRKRAVEIITGSCRVILNDYQSLHSRLHFPKLCSVNNTYLLCMCTLMARIVFVNCI